MVAHFDLDRFFVAVEELKDPTLKGKPVIIGGRDRGVVSTCSYEARKYGVKSGMSSKEANKLCPHAIFISGGKSYKDYSFYSRWVTKIISDKAPLFEKASIDEFYIDLNGMEKFFDPFQWTIDLRQQIIDETLLPISFGLASNKMVAKIATDEAKPNGYLYVQPGKEIDFLKVLKVEKIPGVGKYTLAVLQSLDIKTIGDIQNFDKEQLEERLGKWGLDLYEKSLGIYHGKVNNYRESKSISHENTFAENIVDTDILEQEIVLQTEKCAHQLRKEGKTCGCVAIKIRYPDFETHTKQTTIPYTNLDEDIIPVAKQLFHQLYKKEKSIRLIGVRLSELTNLPMQDDLFNSYEKKQKLYKAIDNIKDSFGKQMLIRAGSKSKKEK